MKKVVTVRQGVLGTLLLLTVLHCLPLTTLASPHIYTDKKTYLPGETIQVYYSGAPGASGDWICIVPSSTPDNDAGPNWQHMPYAMPQGMLAFVAPSPGEYQARAYYGYRTVGYLVATRSSFRVANYAEPARRAYREHVEESPIMSAPDPKLKVAQYALMDRGYDPGTADGVSGRQTRAAIRAFQKDNRLKQTGELNRDTLLALGLISGGAKKENTEDLGARPAEPRPARTAPAPDRRDDRLAPESDKGSGMIDPKDTAKLPEPPVEPKASTPTAPAEASVTGKGQVTAATTLAAEASVMADSLGDVPRGATVDILGARDSFLKVRYNGKEGYINTNFIQRQ